ncbi:hypothetical protein BKA63DRAFT_566014 [Paraphoma chrysanthemicola]|nr:hypothetical protein BKA63DRAFT_566014 [Paraphoma chrysanthemicola]
MEGLAALSIAANIIQVVEFGQNLLRIGGQVYQSGSTLQNSDLEVVLKDFELVTSRLAVWASPNPGVPGPRTEIDQSLETLLSRSQEVAKDLLSLLVDLNFKEDTTRFKSFLQAIQTVWKEKEIASTRRHLEEIRAELQIHFQIWATEKLLEAGDDNSRRVLLAVNEGRDDITKQIEASEARAIEAHKQHLEELTQSNRIRHAKPEDILAQLKAQLYYEELDDHFDDIADAHQTTFHWVLDPNLENNVRFPGLYRWLREDQGVFWICGKAGSGKSTLLKYLSEDPRLQQALESWAGDSQLLVLGFYFFNLGSDLQRSQEGLLRSLLYQAVSQAPSLGQVLFKERFTAPAIGHTSATSHELKRAFHRLQHLDSAEMKIAILVDGLDECEGADMTLDEVATLFITATSAQHMKAVLSSRPLAPFESAFAKAPKLRLHELTQTDIETYVHDVLGKHPRVAALSTDHPKEMEDLINEIVSSASGVFLWVTLVVKSLLTGLQNYELLSDLVKRLRKMPERLDQLFQHMLNSIPSGYKPEASRIIQIVRRYHEKSSMALPTLALKFADRRQPFASAVNPENFSKKGWKKRYNSEIASYSAEVAGRLQSYCLGLLEVRTASTVSDSDSSPADYVDYLHKFVADFLTEDRTWGQIVQHTNDPNFDPNEALLYSFIIQAKHVSAKTLHHYSRVEQLSEEAMFFALELEISRGKSPIALLDDLFRLVGNSSKRNRVNDSPSGCGETDVPQTQTSDVLLDKSWDLNQHGSALDIAATHALLIYVRDKLRSSNQDVTGMRGVQLLGYLCLTSRFEVGNPQQETIGLEIVERLLRLGVSPNEEWGTAGKTIWRNVLTACWENRRAWATVVKLFVQHGADPDLYIDQTIWNDDGNCTQRTSVYRYLKRKVDRLVPLTQTNLDIEVPTTSFDLGPRDANTGDDVMSFGQTPLRWNSEHGSPLAVEGQQVRAIFDEILQLLKAGGVKDEEWHMEMPDMWKLIHSSTPESIQVRETHEAEAMAPTPLPEATLTLKSNEPELTALTLPLEAFQVPEIKKAETAAVTLTPSAARTENRHPPSMLRKIKLRMQHSLSRTSREQDLPASAQPPPSLFGRIKIRMQRSLAHTSQKPA